MHKIYISYAWGDNGTDGGDSREQAVDCLCEAFAQRGYHVVRDKQDMPYRKPIREFMNELAGATALIAVISEKYLRSPYCMYELTAAWDRGDFRHRIFPIVLPDARSLYDDREQFRWVAHWKKELQDYEQQVAHIDDAAKEGFLQKLRDRAFIYQRVSGALAGLAGLVGIAPEKLMESRFAEVIGQVEKRVAGQAGRWETPPGRE